MTDVPSESDPDEVQRFLETTGEGMDVIRLRRKNTFRQALSTYLADLRDRLHLEKDEKRPEEEGFYIDTKELMSRIDYHERLTHFQDCALDNVKCLDIIYESDLKNQDSHQDTANRVFQYLNLDPAPVSTRFQKVTPTDFSEIVSNSEEVLNCVSDSKYSDYISIHKH
jgi:hypothetical protein